MRWVFGETTSALKGLVGWGNRGMEQVSGLAALVFRVIPTAGNSTWLYWIYLSQGFLSCSQAAGDV